MNAVRALTFLWSSWSLAASVFVVLATAGLCFFAWRRSGYRRDYGLVELLRLVIVALAVFIFNQPEWVEEFRPDQKPTIAVLYDGSRSMETRDVEANGSATPTRVMRKRVDRAADRQGVLEETAGQAPHRHSAVRGRRIGQGQQPLRPAGSSAAEVQEPPRHRAGFRRRLERRQAAGRSGVGLAAERHSGVYRRRGQPLAAARRGAAQPRRADLRHRRQGRADSVHDREHPAPRNCADGHAQDFRRRRGEQRGPHRGDGTHQRLADLEAKTIGDYTLTLDVPKHAEELLADNNKLTAPIAIREEKLRVLIVESTPRWEYRYLRNALSRDPGVNLSCLLYHPGLTKVGRGNKDYIKQFPGGRDELGKYDVVFLGDVGVENGQLTPEDCRLLKGLVEHQASGLVFMPGWQGRQLSLLETELTDLYPVVLDASQPGGWGSRTACQFELTELGRRSLLTRLADTQEDNLDVWENLPGFQWYAAVTQAKAGSEVLAVHQELSNEHGRIPLLAAKTFGAGKVLFMGTDGAWRWRKGVEDKYHYRFWGQVVRWMAYQRNMAKGETIRLYYSPEQPQVRQTVVLKANVMERSGEPLAAGDVLARIVAPSGKAQTVRFHSTGEEWGEFTAPFTPDEAGRHELTVSCKQTGASLEASVFVQGAEIERLGRAARPEVLAEIARVTRGQVIEPARLEQVIQSLAALPEPPPDVRRLQLWSHPATIAVMVTLLGVFWIARKVIGLI